MTDDPRVQQLLDELLDSDATPEVVCQPYPELLPVVRDRWLQMRRLCADLDVLFPAQAEPTPQPTDGTELPQIPGYEIEAVPAAEEGKATHAEQCTHAGRALTRPGRVTANGCPRRKSSDRQAGASPATGALAFPPSPRRSMAGLARWAYNGGQLQAKPSRSIWMTWLSVSPHISTTI
jgi:hypothetical protein